MLFISACAVLHCAIPTGVDPLGFEAPLSLMIVACEVMSHFSEEVHGEMDAPSGLRNFQKEE